MPQDLHNGSRTLSVNARGCRVSQWLNTIKTYLLSFVLNDLPYLNARSLHGDREKTEPEVELIEDYSTKTD